MDDMQSGISKILEDPESMAKIREMASSLFGGSGEPAPEPQSTESLSKETQNMGGLEGFDMNTLMKIGRVLNRKSTDNRSALLLALKPHLSEERRGRVDKAVKILKIVDLLPLIKDSGII